MARATVNSRGPVKFIALKYLKKIGNFVKYYIEIVAHPKRFSEQKIRAMQHTFLYKSAGHLIFTLTTFSSLFSLTMSLSSFLAKRGLMPEGPRDETGIILFSKWWVMGVLISLQIVPMALILWFLTRIFHFKANLSQILAVYINQASMFFVGIFCLLFVFFLVVDLPMLAWGDLKHLSNADGINEDILKVGFSIVFPMQVLFFGWALLFVPQRMLSGLIGTSYLKSLAFLAISTIGVIPYLFLMYVIVNKFLRPDI